MGHIDELVERDGEIKPHIDIDCLIRIKAPAGQEIILSDVRNIIYNLRSDRRFRIETVTMDGFQSTDTMQQLRKKKMRVDYLSLDKSTLGYEDLREAIYEERLNFPPYVTYLNKGDTKLVEIVVKELQQLTNTGKKIDHPPSGSKDVADALAGVVTSLMGDRVYRKGVRSRSHNLTDDDQLSDEEWLKDQGVTMEQMRGSAFPIPDMRQSMPKLTGGMGMAIPRHLQTGR